MCGELCKGVYAGFYSNPDVAVTIQLEYCPGFTALTLPATPGLGQEDVGEDPILENIWAGPSNPWRLRM
jgi:hypothetical protein